MAESTGAATMGALRPILVAKVRATAALFTVLCCACTQQELTPDSMRSPHVVDLRRYRQRAGPDYRCEEWCVLRNGVRDERPGSWRVCLRSTTRRRASTWFRGRPDVERRGTDILQAKPRL